MNLLSGLVYPGKSIQIRAGTSKSLLFAALCTMLGIDKTHTSSYRPQSDGFIERQMRTIQEMLSKFVVESQTDWDKHLPILMAAYRATPQDSTHVSPNMMMLGRQLTLPVDLLYGQSPMEQEAQCIPEYCLKTFFMLYMLTQRSILRRAQ